MTTRIRIAGAVIAAALLPWTGAAQQGGQGFPGGQGRPGGPGPGGMGPMQQERKLVAQFDKDNDKRLNAAERKEARTWLASQPTGGPGGRGGRGMMGGPAQPGTPGPKISPNQVKKYGSEPLYDPSILRTFFLEFENGEWDQELTAFNNTDVEVPATLTVDGKVYKNVGVHTRGASSFFGVPEGSKRSLNITLDFVDEKQNLLGYRTLNLLNSHEDPTFLRTVLYLQAAREFVPAPKANFARVVINGESWGIYPNAQQYNKDLVNEWFKTTDGSRWKVPGSPNGRGGLEYLGDDPEAYKRIYEIKSKDDPKAWAAFAKLTKTLNTTPPEQLEKALAPMLDVDGALKFLAVDIALVNGDGYWTRASDYSIYLDTKGVFHVFPHDANETYGPGGGRGGPGGPMGPPMGPPNGPPNGQRMGMPPPGDMGRGGQGGNRMMGPGGGGPELDPLMGMNDASKPLRSKLLAVPALRERYMNYVRQVATKWLDWNTIGPLAQRYQALIAADVKTDTRNLSTYEAFERGVDTLKSFAERRRAFLLAAK